MASFSAGKDGALIATTLPPQKVPAVQNVQGGILNAATAKTVASRAAAAAEYKNLGGGQKGGRRKMKGGAANVPPSTLPTANSVPGVNHTNIMKQMIDNHNQLTASASYDKLGSAQPKLLGGYVKRRRSTKKHGRRRVRTSRRRSRRNSTVRRRRGRSI